MTTPATASSLREAITPRPLLAPDADSSQNTPTPPELTPPRRQAPPMTSYASLPQATGHRHAYDYTRREHSRDS